jgi:PTS system galactitol-specific IIA component
MHSTDLAGGFLSHIETVRLTGAITRDDALTQLAEKAVEAGWARHGYVQALLTREATYPTGLHTRGLDIAIPHADPEWTLIPSMVVGLLEQPAVFQPMGGQGAEVLAKIILLLVIPDADTHVDFLRALSGFIEDPDLLEDLRRTENVGQLIEYLKAALKQGTS